ncbi:PLP-dependent aminotransferase family protein [Bacillus salipaludis]|uniref:PLP-dependent aminotransferase family protein n=1 Tax=Bacillus salipaludis TaxID=2547811 RepID=A0A4V3AT47_9BACI|nr:PLP-dependent aminotransferase family protein [Bacillus salipaludis]MDQ6599035.1 PLP-dependent aminotransferase family protein [Bacillus salipaludis]TDK58274.1 PLP-dependent aminotransferase family protein [Bacillus salipaludis]
MFTIDWKPNKSSSVPLHRQITDFMKEKISNGEWTIGFKLPPQRTLANSLGVNRSTVVAAYDELIAEGLIEGKSGSGTRVVNNTWNLLATTPPPDWNSYVNVGIHQPNLPTIKEINQAEFYPNIIRLGTGELSPSLIPNTLMKKVFNQLSTKEISYGYEEPKGLQPLREQLASYLKTMGIPASPSSILIVSGALQALQLISVGLLHRGSTVLTEKPSYLHSLNVFQSAGMQLIGTPMDREGIETKHISQYKKQHKAALLYTIPSFHNPTGTLMTEERRHQLLEICQQERLPLIEDDVYRELWLDEKPPMPIKAFDKNGLVLYLGSLSKSLSPGLRIGWIVGPEPVVEHLADIKMQTDYGSSSLSQWAATEWFSSGLYTQQLNDVRKELKIRRDFTLTTLNKYFSDLAVWEKPKGGFYVWVRLIPSISIRKLFEMALSEGILLNPGNVYDHQSEQYLRISYSFASLSQIENGLLRLSAIVRRLAK